MAYITAPPINWGGDAPQSTAALTSAETTPSAQATGQPAIPAPSVYSLINTSKGYSI